MPTPPAAALFPFPLLLLLLLFFGFYFSYIYPSQNSASLPNPFPLATQIPRFRSGPPPSQKEKKKKKKSSSAQRSFLHPKRFSRSGGTGQAAVAKTKLSHGNTLQHPRTTHTRERARIIFRLSLSLSHFALTSHSRLTFSFPYHAPPLSPTFASHFHLISTFLVPPLTLSPLLLALSLGTQGTCSPLPGRTEKPNSPRRSRALESSLFFFSPPVWYIFPRAHKSSPFFLFSPPHFALSFSHLSHHHLWP